MPCNNSNKPRSKRNYRYASACSTSPYIRWTVALRTHALPQLRVVLLLHQPLLCCSINHRVTDAVTVIYFDVLPLYTIVKLAKSQRG